MQDFRLIKVVVISVISLIVLIILWPITIIGASNKGLLFKFGALQDKVLEPGIHFILPIRDSVKEVTIQPIQLDHKVEVGGDGAITKDNQTIGSELTVFYKYDPTRITEMYRQFGEEKVQSIIKQSLRESFKSVIGSYDIFKLPLVQDEIRVIVWKNMKEKMAGYPIEITELKIVNYDWSDQFDAQIAETMNRSQQVKQAEQEKLITEQQAQKKVVEANAEKDALIKKAEGEREAARLQAEAKTLEGEGIRKYNESVSKNMDQEIRFRQLDIEKIKAERWNGIYVPTNNYGPIPVQTGNLQGK